jgi:hypothetical protein
VNVRLGGNAVQDERIYRLYIIIDVIPAYLIICFGVQSYITQPVVRFCTYIDWNVFKGHIKMNEGKVGSVLSVNRLRMTHWDQLSGILSLLNVHPCKMHICTRDFVRLSVQHIN